MGRGLARFRAADRVEKQHGVVSESAVRFRVNNLSTDGRSVPAARCVPVTRPTPTFPGLFPAVLRQGGREYRCISLVPPRSMYHADRRPAMQYCPESPSNIGLSATPFFSAVADR